MIAKAWRDVATVTILALLVATCASAARSASRSGRTFSQVGVAGWYGAHHEGRSTASGDHFRKNGMTAAHRSLPMGTIVRVTNLDTDAVVRVRINDRGPFVRARIIDLSAAAARALDFKLDGVARVRIEVFEQDQQRTRRRPRHRGQPAQTRASR
jgi:rare lipoprotein A